MTYIRPMLNALRELVEIPTHEECDHAADLVAGWLEGFGLPYERYVATNESGRRAPVVLARVGPPSASPDILLATHLDTAPAGTGWSSDPFQATERNGRTYGRGVGFPKATAVAYCYALAAARDVATSGRTALLAITADEGHGGALGAGFLIEQRELRPQRVITPGPARAIVTANNGAVQVRLRIAGCRVHSATLTPEQDCWRHVNVVLERVLSLDDDLRARVTSVRGISSPTLNVTGVSGGGVFGMATGEVELLLDRRVTPDESTESAVEELELVVRKLHTLGGLRTEMEFVRVVEPLRVSPEQEQWAIFVQHRARSFLGEAPPIMGWPIYTDARLFGSHGFPTILYGASDVDIARSGLNGANESMVTADLGLAVDVLTSVIVGVMRGEHDSDEASL